MMNVELSSPPVDVLDFRDIFAALLGDLALEGALSVVDEDAWSRSAASSGTVRLLKKKLFIIKPGLNAST